MPEQLDKLPPYNIEAEQAILGAILTEREALDEVTEILEAEDFYKQAHCEIYKTICKIYKQGNIPDVITVSDKLKEEGKLEEVGGVPYLTSLISAGAIAPNVKDYAQLVTKKALLRNLITAGTQIAELGYKEEEEEITKLIDNAEQIIFKIRQKKLGRDFIPLGDIIKKSFEQLEKLYGRQSYVTGIPTGFTDLNSITAGFQPGDLIVLAARPSMGKTALALNIAQYISTREKIPVGIFSLEMSKEQIAYRLISAEAEINLHNLRTGFIAKEEWPKLSNAMSTLAEAPIFLDDTPGLTVMEMRAKARRLIAREKAKILIIDYLQLIRSPIGLRRANRTEEISEISRGLKTMAKELNIPVIAISQLSREVEKRIDKRPQLSDLRESGAIEQEADVVLLIFRPDYYSSTQEENSITELIIAKQRNGPLGTINLLFMKNYTKFVDLETRV